MARTLTGFDWLLGSAYFSNIHASLLSDVTVPMRERTSGLPYRSESVAGAIDAALSSLNTDDVTGSQQAAFDRMLAADLRSIRRSAVDPSVVQELDNRRDMPKKLGQVVDAAVTILRKAGLADIAPPDLHFVDSFPEPYVDSPAVIIATDDGDRLRFGIPPGLHIKPNYRPIYTEYIVCHELIHSYLGQVSPHIYSTRLEEGVADLLGSGWLALQMFPEALVGRLFVLNRLSRASDPGWERYLDATRVSWAFTISEGFERLVQLVSEGRESLARLEIELLSGVELAHPGSHRGLNSAFYRLMTSVCLTYPRSLVVSPAAALVAPHASAGSSLREISAAAGIEIGLVRSACKELQDVAGLLALRPDQTVISFSHADTVARTGAIRYGVPDDAA